MADKAQAALAALDGLLVAAEEALKNNEGRIAAGEGINLEDGVDVHGLADAYFLAMDYEKYDAEFFESLDDRFEAVGELINPDGAKNNKDPRWLLSRPVL